MKMYLLSQCFAKSLAITLDARNEYEPLEAHSRVSLSLWVKYLALSYQRGYKMEPVK